MNLDKQDIILNELVLLQNVIMKQEEMRHKIRNWLISLVTVMVVAFVSKTIALDSSEFLLITFAMILLFFWMEVIYRVAERRAMDRFQDVEEIVRNDAVYDGPKISLSLRRKNYFKDQAIEANNVRIYFPYLALLAIVVALALFY